MRNTRFLPGALIVVILSLSAGLASSRAQDGATFNVFNPLPPTVFTPGPPVVFTPIDFSANPPLSFTPQAPVVFTPIDFNANPPVVFTPPPPVVFTPPTDGGVTFIDAGAGTLTLTGNNNNNFFTGGVTVDAGTITANINNNAGSVVALNGGTLNTITVNNNGAFTGTITGGAINSRILVPSDSPITIPSDGTLTLASGTLTPTDGTETLTVTANVTGLLSMNVGAISATGLITVNTGTFAPSGGVLNLSGATTLNMTGATAGSLPLNLALPVSSQLTINVTPGTNLTTLPTITAANVAIRTVATFMGGVNTNGGTVSLLYLPSVLNLASNPLQLHISEFDNGTHDPYVLEMSYDPTIAASLGDVLDTYLAWLDPSDGTWKNAVDGNSDGGASAHFVEGAYDPTTDFVLGYYGVDTTDSEVWAVIDHNSTFAVGNSETQGVPEPSAGLLLASGLALLGRRRRK